MDSPFLVCEAVAKRWRSSGKMAASAAAKRWRSGSEVIFCNRFATHPRSPKPLCGCEAASSPLLCYCFAVLKSMNFRKPPYPIALQLILVLQSPFAAAKQPLRHCFAIASPHPNQYAFEKYITLSALSPQQTHLSPIGVWSKGMLRLVALVSSLILSSHSRLPHHMALA